MAIVNEDPAMVKFLLDNDEWMLHNTRGLGTFFSADDQRKFRSDIPGSEEISLKTHTNYKG